MKYESFKKLIPNYKVIFFDSYGVLKTYRGMIEGANDAIKYVKEQGILFKVLTNDASRSPAQLVEALHHIGLNEVEPADIVTSGMMAKDFLDNKRLQGKSVYLGTQNSAAYIFDQMDSGIHVRDYEESMLDDVGSLVFLDDEGYEWQECVNKVLNLLRKKVIPTIVANSDLIYPVAKNDVSIATGSIALLIEHVLHRRFIHFGKPDIPMYNYAYQEISEVETFQKRDILMVGDTLHTDILGGIKFGVDTALVCTGNTLKENVHVAVESTGIKPDYVCDSIAL